VLSAPRPRAGQAVRWWQELPAWLQVLLVYLISRGLDFLIVGRVARFQAPSPWNSANPGYLGIVSLWDGDWYRRIAENGYPQSLPIDGYGHVAQNEWAFYPLYPFTTRVVMRIFGAGWPLSASIVSLICSALAVVVMRDVVDRLAGRDVALWTVALFCFFPVAPVLQLAYTESLAILLLVGMLWCLQRRRYLTAVPVVLLIGFARPIGVPVAAVVGLHVLTRLLRHRSEPVRAASLAAMSALVAAAAVAAVEWMVVAGRVTGVSDAYTQSMGAWRSGHQIVPLKPWWWMSRYFLGDWVGPVVLGAVVLVGIWALTRPAAQVIAGDLRAWVFCYLAYLAVVLEPSSSLFRYLMPLFPIGTVAAAASPSSAYRRTLLVAFVAGQVVWVSWLWRFSPPTDWPP
jgi:hypothetical protein